MLGRFANPHANAAEEKNADGHLAYALGLHARDAASRLGKLPAEQWSFNHLVETSAWLAIERMRPEIDAVGEVRVSVNRQLAALCEHAAQWSDEKLHWDALCASLAREINGSPFPDALAARYASHLSVVNDWLRPSAVSRPSQGLSADAGAVLRRLRFQLQHAKALKDAAGPNAGGWAAPQWFAATAARIVDGHAATHPALQRVLEDYAEIARARLAERAGLPLADRTTAEHWTETCLALATAGCKEHASGLAPRLGSLTQALSGRRGWLVACLLELLVRLHPNPASLRLDRTPRITLNDIRPLKYDPSPSGAGRTLAYWREQDAAPQPAAIIDQKEVRLPLRMMDFLEKNTAPSVFPGRYAGQEGSDCSILAGRLAAHVLRAAADAFSKDSVRVAPWPDDVDFILTCRFDVDRPLTERQWLERKRICAQAGLKTSWHMRAVTADPALATDIATSHEIGWHADHWSRDEEWRAFRNLIPDAIPVIGFSPHGGAHTEGDRGAAMMERAGALGLSYACVDHCAALQPGFHHAGDEPAVAWMGKPASIDYFTRAQTFVGMQIIDRLWWIARHGGVVQVMNHPDLNDAELEAVIAALVGRARDEGLRWKSMTLGETAQWALATRAGGLKAAFSTDRQRSRRLEITSAGKVRGAVLEVATVRQDAVVETAEGVTMSLAERTETQTGPVWRWRLDCEPGGRGALVFS